MEKGEGVEYLYEGVRAVPEKGVRYRRLTDIGKVRISRRLSNSTAISPNNSWRMTRVAVDRSPFTLRLRSGQADYKAQGAGRAATAAHE